MSEKGLRIEMCFGSIAKYIQLCHSSQIEDIEIDIFQL